MHRMILCALAAAMALVASGVRAETISMDQVPAEARAAAMHAAGSVKLTEVGLDLNGGQATYEFTGKDTNDRQVEVDVLADGKILEIEHEIGQDELPQAVLDATKPYLPDFQPKFIERSIRTGQPVSIYYELEGAGPDGKEVDVEVYESGGLVTIQQDVGF
jgi:hypothetical protein